MNEWRSLAMEAVGLVALITLCVQVQYSLSYHIKDERVNVKVGLLLHTADHAALEHAASTLHLQAGGGNAGQLEALQVPNAPC